MKYKIYEDDNIIVYSKKEIEIGNEPEIADSAVMCAMEGYRSFSNHIKGKKDKVKFRIEVGDSLLDMISDYL